MADHVRAQRFRGAHATASARSLAGGCLAAALLLLGACGGGDDADRGASATTPSPAAEAEPRPAAEVGPHGELIVPLVEENDSGASGTATLSKAGGASSVALEIEGDDGRFQAHVHDVSCREYRHMDDTGAQLATLTEGLSNVTRGASESALENPLAAYTGGGFSINVHEYEPPYPVVACGDLSAP